MSDKDEMKTDMVSQLASMMMERNPSINIEQALDEIFKSDTYKKIMNEATGLYYQSAGYVYSFLDEELHSGRIQ